MASFSSNRRASVQAAYSARLQRDLAGTVWNAGGCASWYMDSKGRNTTLWPGFTFRFRERTRRFDPKPYVAVPAPLSADAPAEPVAA